MIRSRIPKRLLGVAVAAGLVLAVGGCAELPVTTPAAAPAAPTGATAAATRPPTPRSSPSTAGTRSPVAGAAVAQLGTLRVAGRAPMTGYGRDRFGQPWLDADRNGCDTRNDLLRRDLHDLVVKPGTRGCLVLSGTLEDPYTRTRIAFVRGAGASVDIDHVVALGNAWVSGAWRFDVRRRAALANDPLNLLAVDAGANRSKGDADAATWLPPNRSFRCAYVARQVAVKAKYHLSVTVAERAQVARQLVTCPGWPATPDRTRAPTWVDQAVSDPGAAPTRSSAPQPAAGGGGTVYYRNCDAARAAGAAPVLRGEPGYGPHLDRDGDGTACE